MSETDFSSDWIDAFTTDDALKVLNVSQIDLYYLYTSTRSRKHTHATAHNIYTCRLHRLSTVVLQKHVFNLVFFFRLQAQRLQLFYIQYWTAK